MAPDPEYFYIYRLLHFCIGYQFLTYLEYGFSAYFKSFIAAVLDFSVSFCAVTTGNVTWYHNSGGMQDVLVAHRNENRTITIPKYQS